MGHAAGAFGQTVGHHGIPVILTGDVHPVTVQVLDRLIEAPMPVFELDGFGAPGNGQQLMAEANAENRLAVVDEILDVLDELRIVHRISWSVGQHDAVGIEAADVVDIGVGGHDRDITAEFQKLVENVVLIAVIHQRDVIGAVFSGVIPTLFGAGHGLDGLHNPMGFDGRKELVFFIIDILRGDASADGAVFANAAG